MKQTATTTANGINKSVFISNGNVESSSTNRYTLENKNNNSAKRVSMKEYNKEAQCRWEQYVGASQQNEKWSPKSTIFKDKYFKVYHKKYSKSEKILIQK